MGWWGWRRGRSAVAGAAALALGACVTPGTPDIDGRPGAPARPSTPWPVPPSVRTPPPTDLAPSAPQATNAIARDAATTGDVRDLSLTDVVDLALRNNPATRESWALARAQVDAYGAARGALFPSLDAGVNATRSQSAVGGVGGAGSTSGAPSSDSVRAGTGSGASGTRSTLAPSLTLSYLVFDLGGRAGTIEAAKQRAIAADLAHNATVQNVVLQTESALFSFLATRALRDAQGLAVQEAQADLAAAQERHRVGVATIQDVLQTRTALSQARLQAQTLESDLASARGGLAVAMGLQANARFEIPAVAAGDSAASVVSSVDSLIGRAIAARPELAGARAEAAALAAEVRVARAAGFPALTLRTTGGYTASQPSLSQGRSYSVVLGLQIPIFNGFARQYDTRSAREQYEAGLARVTSTTQQVSLQVYTAYYAQQAAAQRVRTSTDLVADARQSADVAFGRYRAGVGTLVDVLLARSALATARAEAIQARWEWRTSLVQLAHDVGTLDLGGRPGLPLGPAGASR